MGCSCLKNDFNLSIDDRGCKTILIEDLSNWMAGDFFNEGETLPITIKSLSLGKSFDLSLKINKRNIYTSLDVIGIADVCIPDDVYCFSTTSCGVSYSINRVYLCSTLCKIEQLKSKAKDKLDWEYIRELQNFVEQIKANSEFGKIDTAVSILKLLNKKLKNLKCGSC